MPSALSRTLPLRQLPTLYTGYGAYGSAAEEPLCDRLERLSGSSRAELTYPLRRPILVASMEQVAPAFDELAPAARADPALAPAAAPAEPAAPAPSVDFDVLFAVLLRHYKRLAIAAKRLSANLCPVDFDGQKLESPGAVETARADSAPAQLHVLGHALAAAIATSARTFHLGDVGNLELSADIAAAVRALPPDTRVSFLDYLSMKNSLLGESNPILAAMTASNVNVQPLISTEAALQAIFYLIKYMTKDSMQPADLLAFVRAARLRLV